MSFDIYKPDAEDASASETLRYEAPVRGLHENSHEKPSRSFDQLWGLHPGIALLALVVNTMLFGAELASFGALFPLAIVVGIVLGLVTYRAQVRWHGDDDENALIKAVIITVLTVIPTPLPDFLYLSSGALGLVHSLRRES